MKNTYRKILTALAVVTFAGFTTNTSFALPMDSLVVDPNLSDSYTNPADLNSTDPNAELTWLKNLLGSPLNQVLPAAATTAGVDFVKIDNSVPISSGGFGIGVQNLVGLNPHFNWTYATVRFGGPQSVIEHYAVQDTYDDNILVFDFSTVFNQQYGISHVTFFSAPTHDDHHAPEPATMLLFGVGLAGLAGVIRRKG